MGIQITSILTLILEDNMENANGLFLLYYHRTRGKVVQT